MVDLLKFVVVTRGRTGSTTITEELGQAPGCRCEQEAFSRSPDVPFYQLPPFEAWRDKDPGRDEETDAEAYLDVMEGQARAADCRALFWKALSHHFDERPYLGALLQRRGYRAIYLRRAPVRQVLSGLIARQRGLYNSFTPVRDRRRYPIDPEELRRLARVERFAAARDEGLLYKYRLTGPEAHYEDYAADRAGFFEGLYTGLGLPVTLPPPSRYAIMTPDLKSVVANFDEIRAVAADLGERL